MTQAIQPSCPIEVLMKHYLSPLKSEKLQFVGLVMGLSLGQAPASIGDDGTSPVIMGLVKDSP